MRRVLIVVMLLGSGQLYAQLYVDGVDISAIKVKYIEVIIIFKMTKTVIAIDYGQKRRFKDDQRVENADGKVINFTGLIAAINFMDQHGWYYINSLDRPKFSENMYYYIFERKPL